MRASVQLGLLCLSLLISSLDGGEIDTENSMEIALKFDMEDFSQFQVSENEEEQNHLSHDPDIIPVKFRTKRQENGKSTRRKKPRPGGFGILAHNPSSTRVKRQTDNVGHLKPDKRKKPRPGKFSLLARPSSQVASGKLVTS